VYEKFDNTNGQSEALMRRTDNTMIKRHGTKIQTILDK